jgi:tripartite-type tricarboxylate transporter receptor subunit TctC
MSFQIFRRSRRVLLLALATLAFGTSAQTWPERPIKLVEPIRPPACTARSCRRCWGSRC